MIGQELSDKVNNLGQRFISDAQQITEAFSPIDSTEYNSIATEVGDLRKDMDITQIKAKNRIREAKNGYLDTTEAMNPAEVTEGAKNLVNIELSSQALDEEGKEIMKNYNDTGLQSIEDLADRLGDDGDFTAGLLSSERDDLELLMEFEAVAKQLPG